MNTNKKTSSIFTFIIATLFCAVSMAAEPANEWKFAGWYGGGMYPALVPDPQNEGRVYLSSDVAGLWRSDDRGDHWYFADEGMTSINVAVIAIAPSDTNVIYAGTKGGLMRSADGGKSWRLLETSKYLDVAKEKLVFSRPDNYRSILVDKKDPKKVTVGTANGEIFVSNDMGNIWTRLGVRDLPFGEKAPITCVLLSRDERYLFASSKLGLMRFEFKASEWKKLPVGEKGIYDALFYGDPNILYVATGKKIAFSSDYGESWNYSDDLPKGEAARVSVTKGKEGATRILAGWKDGWSGGVFLSDDHGQTWQNIGNNLNHDEVNNPTRSWMKGFQRPNAVQIDSFNPNIFYYTDSWGVWRSDDSGSSWHEKINGAPNSCGSDIQIDENGTIYVASMDDGLLMSKDGGGSYQSLCPTKNISIGGGHAWRVIPDSSAHRIIATYSPWNKDKDEILLSQDEGKTFEVVTEGLPAKYPRTNTMWGQGYPRAFATDPSDRNRLYLGIDGNDGGGLFISTDKGRNWKRSEGQPGALRVYNGLAVDPTAPNRVLWGACGEGGGIYLSEDKGKIWQKVFSKLNWVFDAAISNQGAYYAAGGDGKPAFYKSIDHGKTWTLLYRSETGHAMDAITLDTQDENNIFVSVVKWNDSSGGQVLHSNDGGATWKDISAGLPEFGGAAAMAVSPKEKMLYVLLYSGSVYKRPLLK